jgi:hypothetical protein
MKTIRVFVSSPGDVRTERTIADRLVRMTAEEVGIPVSVQYSNLLRDAQVLESPSSSIQAETSELILCPYFWEYQRFSPELGYQDQMPNTAQFDLVICILWSRLGTKLHPRFQMPDGSAPRSGTDFEIAWARTRSRVDGPQRTSRDAHTPPSGCVLIESALTNCVRGVPIREIG